jgi:biotin operon repressor
MSASLAVIESAEEATVLLKADHQRLLEMLATPNSAAGLARELGWSRQIVNYHLRELEQAGLIVMKEERKRGNCLERVMERKAQAYLIGPQTMGGLAAEPERVEDKLSAAYLIAVAARMVREVSRLMKAADQAGKRLPTLTIETEIRFANAAARKLFTQELATMTAALVSRYHDQVSPDGRKYRLIVGAHPLVAESRKRVEQ